MSMPMEIGKILKMNGGAGHGSYANNSTMQRDVIAKSSSVLEETVKELYNAMMPEHIVMADFGCSSGPNALTVVSQVIDITDEASRNMNQKAPQLRAFLNDLAGNDFNNLFSLFDSFHKRQEEEKGIDFGPCFVFGAPGSFYGRVFPDHFLHLVHSSSSLHWLSQVPKPVGDEGRPLNKGHIHIIKTSPPEVKKAYYEQFKRDFTSFLRSRSRELIPGGRMVLTFFGSIEGNVSDHSTFPVLDSALRSIVLEGLLEEEKLDLLNLPYYAPTSKEVTELIELEGSFALNKLETSEVDLGLKDSLQSLDSQANFVTQTVRAVTEPIIASALGNEVSMDDLYLRFQEMIKERILGGCSLLSIVVSATKL